MLTRLKRFLRDGSGNFSMMMAVVTVPLMLGAGLAVDASNIARDKAALQQAIDAAVLAIAAEGEDITDERALAIARQYLSGNFKVSLTAITIKRIGTQVILSANSATELAFGGLFGHATWPIASQATADIAHVSYEIGLVLDTTGSMAGGKLVSMKDAVHSLIDSMSGQVKDKEKLKFALVPFSSFVNVGSGYGPSFDKKGKQIVGTGAKWLDLQGESGIEQQEFRAGVSRFQILENIRQDWGGCVETRPVSGGVDLSVADIAPDASKPDTLFVPAFAIDEEDSGYSNSYLKGNVKTTQQSTAAFSKKMKKYGVPVFVNGKVVPYGQKNKDNPDSVEEWTSVDGGAVNGKGPNKYCVTQPITPLTNDYSALKKKVSALQANGNTNIMEGVAWGMRVLSPGEPFTQGQDKIKTGVQKMMIVLTDGSNVLGNNSTELGSTYSSFGYLADGRLGISSGTASQTNAKMNERTLEACRNAKADGVEVYTIRLEEPNVATGNMLKECASSPEHYFDVPTRAKLEEAFSKIRDSIVRIRISS